MEESQKNLLQRSNKTQAAFVPKLFLMVEDSKTKTAADPNPTQPLICWSKMGDVFCVYDPIEFSRIILPRHFKHNNWQSFVRQLNMYGFHKVNDLLSVAGGVSSTTEIVQAWEFRHPHFRRGRPDLLSMIKRKSNKQHASRNSTITNLNPTDSRFNRQKPRQGNNYRPQQLNSKEAHPQHVAHFNRAPDNSGLNGRPYWMVYPPSSFINAANQQTNHRFLHGHPPPPPLYADKQAGCIQAPRPPALYPLSTPESRNSNPTLSSSRSPSHTHKIALRSSESYGGDADRSSTAFYLPLTVHNSSISQAEASNFHHQRSQIKCADYADDVMQRNNTNELLDRKRNINRGDEVLDTIESELRRLNENIDRKNALSNQVVTVLGSVVELVTCLVENDYERGGGVNSTGKLSSYVRMAKDALGKIDTRVQNSNGSNDAPSTDSLSPLSLDPNERATLRSANSPRKSVFSETSSSIQMEWTRKLNDCKYSHRPSVSARSASLQSLPPLKALLGDTDFFAPKHSSLLPCPSKKTLSTNKEVSALAYEKKLPDSINRLMNGNQGSVRGNSEEVEEEEEEEEEEDDDDDDEEDEEDEVDEALEEEEEEEEEDEEKNDPQVIQGEEEEGGRREDIEEDEEYEEVDEEYEEVDDDNENELETESTQISSLEVYDREKIHHINILKRPTKETYSELKELDNKRKIDINSLANHSLESLKKRKLNDSNW
uniref:HSF-type DNA-binding domain-containing protein n=1 Tax=Phakopsora pachyrhizi TaxID=170000 RepID=I6UM85_PHAPC|nr:hypothetical protein [Phakopsora pachyrhizi]AFN02857.1 hypothetical protein [Phakopsora pachyrhizi]